MRITSSILAALVVATGVLVAPNAAVADPSSGSVVTEPTSPAEDDEVPVPAGDDILDAPAEDDSDLPLPPKPGPDTIDLPDADTICDPGTAWLSDWTSAKKSNVITHARGFVIPEGGSGKYSKSVEFQAQLKSTITYSSKASISAKIVEIGLEGEVGLSLAAEGQVTSKKTRTVETSVTKSGTYVFFVGRRRAQGNFTGGRCSGSGKSIARVVGKMSSYNIPYEGAVWCGEKPKKGSFKAVAKKYCD